jgi:bifunctional UDP-N-acetylglucosamine pyrophosphorylase/glucosamine-1-phosphate N-acetyltransferase
VLASRPHLVEKEVNGRLSNINEYFITDLIEYIHDDGLSVGYILAEDEEEVMGIDDLAALTKAQEIYESILMPKDINN